MKCWKVFIFAILLFGIFSCIQARPIVVIDPGHGGEDRGGLPGQRIPEKVMTLDVGLRLERILLNLGYKVVMTRQSDRFVSLAERCRVANRIRNCIFVSIHFDAYYNSRSNGVSTHYAKYNSGRLATLVHRRLVQRLNPMMNRGVKRARFYVIRNTYCPSILVEGGFLTNRRECERILSPNYRQAMANAIAQGILDYGG
ncbi:MAG: N-acetylmuramoyl-L-alanine amidase [Verrucomicrobiae bacterium]|nr:N-acetylmuramoyl-L-alanine amidase [Verrucomicrobiae bacterium]